MLDKILEGARFIVELSSRKVALLLLALLLGTAGWIIYELREENKSLHVTIIRNNSRDSTNTAYLQKQISECNSSRINDAEESSKYWREKVDELQAEVRRNYETIKKR